MGMRAAGGSKTWAQCSGHWGPASKNMSGWCLSLGGSPQESASLPHPHLVPGPICALTKIRGWGGGLGMSFLGLIEPLFWVGPFPLVDTQPVWRSLP